MTVAEEIERSGFLGLWRVKADAAQKMRTSCMKKETEGLAFSLEIKPTVLRSDEIRGILYQRTYSYGKRLIPLYDRVEDLEFYQEFIKNGVVYFCIKGLGLWRMQGAPEIRENGKEGRELWLSPVGVESPNSISSTQKEENFIAPGKSYTGLKKIHAIIKEAEKDLLIQDDYLDEGIFELLEITHVDVIIKLMGKKTRGAFLQYLKVFSDQRGQDVSHKANTQCHDRFIIVDHTIVYHLGHSIKDVGKRASMINRIETDKEKEEIVLNFDKWWNTGTSR